MVTISGPRASLGLKNISEEKARDVKPVDAVSLKSQLQTGRVIFSPRLKLWKSLPSSYLIISACYYTYDLGHQSLYGIYHPRSAEVSPVHVCIVQVSSLELSKISKLLKFPSSFSNPSIPFPRRKRSSQHPYLLPNRKRDQHFYRKRLIHPQDLFQKRFFEIP